MSGSWRRRSAFYLVTFFCVATAAPHHHLDPIADLISDGPSNSGTFAQITGPIDPGQGFYPGALVQDEPCLACFHRDFLASPAVSILLALSLEPLPHRLAPASLASPVLVSADTSSRAPPIPA